MSRKRASLLTIGSLAALSKVSISFKSLNSIQTRALLAKNLSTAPQIFDFQNPNGFDGEDCKEYQQNHSGFYSNNPNNVTFQHEPSGDGQGWVYRGIDREFQRNSDAFHKSNSNEVGQNPRIDLQHNPVGQSEQNPRIDFQQNPVAQNYNINGYCTGNSGKLWQNPSGFNTESSRTLEQNTHNYYTGSTGNFQHVQGNNYGGNGNFQHGHGNNFAGNAGFYQQNPSGYHGENAEGPNGYLRGKVGEYQQNPIGNYSASVGHYQHISNESHNGTVDPQESSNFKPQDELVEAAQVSVLSGTVDELDNFCKEGKLKEAMEVLGLLEQKLIPIDMARYLMLMKACGEARALQEAKAIHEHLVRSVSHLEVSTYNKILEMYSKCGSMADAYIVFDKMPQRNLTSWDTMVTWLAMNGLGEDAIELFTQFKESGLKPDGQMFFGVFSACSVLGDVDEGLLHFESMSKNYGIDPSMEHYVSIVDMLGSAGYLDEALEFIEKMPKIPSVGVWETLMNLCRIHGNMELGDRCAELIEILDPSFLNEQSKAGLIPIKASDIAKEREKKKLSGQNLLEVRSRVHEYRAGDTSHPDNDKIYALLRGMKQQLKEAGYVPETKFVLHDIDQEGKEEALLAHSERLAVAQGLMTSPARAPMRIIKNLRVCGDCHNALKIISKLVGRELIIRDAKRFHHFKDGLCSCRDYW